MTGATSIADAHEMISRGEVDLLTCDVFDTLVWRPIAEPHHLFVDLGRRMLDAGDLPAAVDPAQFVLGRVHAERRARERNRRDRGSTECTLEEIWALVPDRWHRRSPDASASTLDEWRERGRDLELAVEASALGVHEHIAALLRHAHDLGVATALVSDTYFSETQLRSLLEAAGAPLASVDRIVVSSERDLAKYAGLLRDVVGEAGSIPHRTVHLGDNPIADIRAAEDLGAVAVASAIEPDELVAPGVLDELVARSAGTGDDRGVSAAAAALLIDDEVRDDPAAGFGVAVGGPLMYGFADWASRTAGDLGVDTVHCLLREGGFIADLLEIVRPDGPTPLTVHASRWVMLRAAVFEGTPDELLRALARNVRFEPGHLVEAFGVDEHLVHRVLGDRPFTDLERDGAMDRIAADHELRGEIVASSAALRRRLIRSLDPVLRPTDGRIVICDIGWGGTIQEALDEILRHEGRLAPDDDLIGLYLSLSTAGDQRIANGARMLGYLPTDAAHERQRRALQRTPEIIEQLCTPNVGTLLDVDVDGTPVTAPSDATWTESRGRAQAATRRMVRRLAAIEGRLHERGWPYDVSAPASGHESMWCEPSMRSALLRGLASTLEAPTQPLAVELSSWLHDDVAGGSVVPLANPDGLSFLPFLSGAEIDTVSMRDVFWLPGAAAAANPALAAQLTAASRGVDPTQLSPESEAGRATVAVYEPGAQNAVAVLHPTPHVDARGWSLLRLATATPAVRDIRIDFGDIDHIVELDHLTISFDGGSGDRRTVSTWTIDRFDDHRLRWVGGRTIGASRAAVRAGGHAIIGVGDRPEAGSDHVEIECAFRATALRDDDAKALLTSAARERVADLTHRVRAGLAARAHDLRRRRAPTAESDDGPTFSIVLPIYESPLDHLEQQLHAIREQQHTQWECIVVDDGSVSPAPRELVERFAGADERFMLYVRPDNGGIAAATNDALDRASNEWVVFVDHDDVIHTDALAAIAEHIGSHTSDDVIYTDEHTIDATGGHIVEYRKPDFSSERLLGQNYFCHIVTMRRDLVERVGRLDRAFEPFTDNDFNLRAVELADGVGHVPRILYSWRATPGSVAVAIDEKSGAARSVKAATEHALERRNRSATVRTVPGHVANVLISEPSVAVERAVLTIDDDTAPAAVDHFLRDSASDVVILTHESTHESIPNGDPDVFAPLVSLCARTEVAVVGPRLVSTDGRLISAGRVHAPAFGDPFQGVEAENPGPWGAFLVTREVTSVSPIGAVLDRRAVIDAGGFDLRRVLERAGAEPSPDVDLDGPADDLAVVMAVLCAVLWGRRQKTLWTPLATIELPARFLLDDEEASRRSALHRRVSAILPAVADERFLPSELPEGR